MSYLLPRRRTAIVTLGDAKAVKWPVPAEVRAELSPEDFFGAVSSRDKRSVLYNAAPGQGIAWSYNTGEYTLHSDHFLSAMALRAALSIGIEVEFAENVLIARFGASSITGVMEVVQFLEHQVLCFFSLTNDVYIHANLITASVGGVELRYHLTDLLLPVRVTNETHRQKSSELALEFSTLSHGESPRLLIAAWYYQQALRLSSPQETKVPGLNVSEIALNLAKSLEVLFGSHDQVRMACGSLGFSSDEIESQIIPILLTRNKLDVSHRVGTRIEPDLVPVIVDYVGRARQNVRSVLVRTAEAFRVGSHPLVPLDAGEPRRDGKLALIDSLKSYLDHAPLRSQWEAPNISLKPS